MRVDRCGGMCTEMRAGMRVDMRVEGCGGRCVKMCDGMRVDMRVDMRGRVWRHVYGHVCRRV